jgi:stress-induced-phosphoprotein 1
LQADKITEAIEHYSAAIRLDGANHVYFSNRSAAYLKKGDAHNALEDADAVIGLKPDFAKGYSRKGSALHALKRYNDSMAAYAQGLSKFPDDAALKKGLQDVQREKENPYGTSASGAGKPAAGAAGAGGMGLFGPEMMQQMAMDPRLRPYLNDESIMAKIKLAQNNPSMLQSIMQDPQMMEMLTIMMGKDGDDDDAAASAPTPSAAKKQAAKPVEEPMEVEEDWSNLSPEERKKKETQKAAKDKKEEGNTLYKAKKFEEALAAYDEAIAIDPTTMTYHSNKAAVYFAEKKYDECIATCLEAVEVGNKNRAPFEDRAKAYTRAAKAYQKKKDLTNAIEMCNKAQMEAFDKDTQRLLKTMELEKRKGDAQSYLSDEKAEEAKQRGNDFFREKAFGEAVKEYEEAVKRAPKNAAIRNNLSAALCKIMDFSGAQRQVEVALDIDPSYLKAWARKGDIEMVMKEHHKAMESYKKGLELDSTNVSCREGYQKCVTAINYGRKNMTEDEKKEQAAHGMADPQIQAILQDPVIQQVLKDFGENQNAAQQAMKDPSVRNKINKLIAAGIIETA